jgi:threonine/homoserine/homoserine lactone efflux protein
MTVLSGPGTGTDTSNTRTHECTMIHHAFLSTGLLVGLSIAVPIGTMSLLCIQRTLASGMRAGVSTGLGAATVNVTYGAMILLGLDKLAPWIAGGGRLLTALGGLFLLWSAARTFMRGRALAEQPEAAVQSPLAAYGSAVLLSASNPMSLILTMALLAPVAGPSFGDGTVLLLGMFAAAATWWVCLSGGVALLRARLSPAVLVFVNRVAGLFLTLYGALTLGRSIRM